MFLKHIRAKLGLTGINAIWMMCDKAFAIIAGLIVTPLVARHLGPNGFGTLSYVLALAYLLRPIATLGLDSLVVKLLRDADDPRVAMYALLRSRIISGVVAGVCVPLLVLSFEGYHSDLFLVALALAIWTGLSFTDLLGFGFLSKLRSRKDVISRVCASILAVGIRVVLLLTGGEVAAFAFVLVVERIVLLLMSLDLCSIGAVVAPKEWKLFYASSAEECISSDAFWFWLLCSTCAQIRLLLRQCWAVSLWDITLLLLV